MSLKSQLSPCNACPRKCSVDRMNGQTGFCGLDHRIHISWAGLHFGEEPCFSGRGGVGNIFFSSCNMACVYCQNFQISRDGVGDRVYSVEEFAETALDLQSRGVDFLGLVSPSHQAPQIREGLVEAKKQGLTIPVLYNSSGYDSVEQLKAFEGLVDCYLPDLRYSDDVMAEKYSKAPGYVEASRNAVQEMHRQAGEMKIDPETGLAEKGVWARVLVLPNDVGGVWETMCFLALEISPHIGLSVMAQYSPLHEAEAYPEIARPVSREEYDRAVDMARDLGFSSILVQDLESSRSNAVPDFTDSEKPFASF